LEVFGGELRPRLGQLQCNSGLQTARRIEIMTLIGGIGTELKWNPHIRRGTEIAKIKAGRDDANHYKRVAAERDRFANNLRISRKAPAPKTMAEHHHFVTVRQVLLRCEGAAENRCRSEKAEIIGAHLSGLK